MKRNSPDYLTWPTTSGSPPVRSISPSDHSYSGFASSRSLHLCPVDRCVALHVSLEACLQGAEEFLALLGWKLLLVLGGFHEGLFFIAGLFWPIKHPIQTHPPAGSSLRNGIVLSPNDSVETITHGETADTEGGRRPPGGGERPIASRISAARRSAATASTSGIILKQRVQLNSFRPVRTPFTPWPR